MQVKPIDSLTEVDSKAWNMLAGDSYPFLRHEFLLALEQSGCVCEKTGWLPKHLLVFEGNELITFMPMYLKRHSYGEYVFDHQWAHTYHQYGLAYYPKWLTAIPFTPCQGARLCCKPSINSLEITRLLFDFIQEQSDHERVSSWHCLFPAETQLEQLRSLGLGVRESVQFQWFNRGYRDFNDFLETMSASKRKMVKRERRRIVEQGIEFLKIPGKNVSEQQWRIFFQFYSLTYLKKDSEPYLNLAFFLACAKTLGNQLLMVMAVKNNQYVGAALSFIGSDTLYGRYWGCYEEFNALHFEACYYQGLDYCIEHNLQRFDSGAQGEHKISRGFEPVTTYSAHWLKDKQFAEAIYDFLRREQQAVQVYKQSAATYLPFKTTCK
ncbi:MAG: GNAT family N-acetyltransferase [Methylococcaceae bacterium]